MGGRAAADGATDAALELIRALAGEIGPRRPTGAGEREAASLVSAFLGRSGIKAGREPFRGPATFAWAQGWPAALALTAPGWGGVLAGLAEADLRLEPVSRLVGRRWSQNVVGTIEAAERPERTLVLVSHLDSSRSGLTFHPRVSPHLRKLSMLMSAVMIAQAVGSSAGAGLRRQRLAALARLVLAGGLALLAEREIRGVDVAGANDNASGVAVASVVAAELALAPLPATRVVFLATGCEESGTAGMRSFLEQGDRSWGDWIFLNLDGLAAPATLRYLPREGVTRMYAADARLIAVCERLAARRPDLGLQRQPSPAGLTYDSTPVLARGGRALTLSAQDRGIPNYHTASDVPQNAERDVLARAIEVVREVVDAVERGEAD